LQGKVIPDKKDRESWWAFLAGKPEAEWNRPKKTKAAKNKDRFRGGMRSFSEEQDDPSDRTEIWSINEDGDVEPIAETKPRKTSDTPPPFPDHDTEIESLEPHQKPREPTPSLLQHIDGVCVSMFHIYVRTPWD
jgi:Survival motor neuron (SMN) interacting protein 1 (SIP1)